MCQRSIAAQAGAENGGDSFRVYPALAPFGTGFSGWANAGSTPSGYPISKSIPSETSPIIFRGSRFTTNSACLFLRVGTLLFYPGQDGSGVVAEVDVKPHQLLRFRDVAHSLDRTDSHIDLFEDVERDRRLDGRRLEFAHQRFSSD
jgi:hypothetical protein